LRSRWQNLLAVLLCCAASAGARDAGPQWIRISSRHFSLLTDGSEQSGTEAILRLEQMRAAFGQLLMRARLTMPEPLDVIAFRTTAEFAAAAPIVGGQPISTSGFFLPGEDRNYIVLDLADSESWQVVSRPWALLWLNYNYPPTPAWFDEGFAQYFSSLRLDNQQQQIGSDPASLVDGLNTQTWLPIAQLFNLRRDRVNQPGVQPAVFQAESWMVVHYLLDQNQLPATGTYFGLAEHEKLPVEQAIQQAYGLSAEQFEQAVKSYFHSVAPRLKGRDGAGPAGTTPASPDPVHRSGAPVGPEDIGSSLREVPVAEAQALVAEMMVRIPERREAALKNLEGLIEQPKTENAIAHRASAWVHLESREYDQAAEELGKAFDLDHNDVWARYYMALVRLDQPHSGPDARPGLANIMQNLRAVLDWNPDFAEAYNRLALAQLEGGGVHAALVSMSYATRLNPRNQTYRLNLAHIYLAGKQWDDASALLGHLQDSRDAHIAATARQDLADLPTLKKYGVRPDPQSAATQPPQSASSSDEDEESASQPERTTAPAQTAPDRRKVQFLRGKLISVDCSQAPVAVLRVAVGARTLKLRTDNYKTLLLVGDDQFSCAWQGISVLVNYKAGGKAGEKTDGDLVSLELR
jgi:tetratricopeptide (TPR) repeat protein